MPSPIEELALKDLIGHPKLMILYAAFVGIGWLGNRLVPSAEEKDAERWREAYYHERSAKDSVQRSKDELYTQLLQSKALNLEQHETIKTVDSLLTPLGGKAKQILKNNRHEN